MLLHGFVIVLSLLIFLATGRPIYQYVVTLYTKRVLAPFELSLDKLLYSYEEITYYINIPTNNPSILNARREDLSLETEYTSFLFPKVKGIRVYQQTGVHQKMLIAYLPVERYCIPLLRIFMLRGQLTKEAYDRIVACKLLQKQTVQEILEEVHAQMRRTNRFV